MGEDSKARACGRDDGRGTIIQAWREEIKGEGAFRVEKWATWQGFVLGMHGVRTGKNGFKERREGWCGEGRGRCFGCGEEGLYVGQCLKASPRKCFFSCGEIGHLSLQCRRGPMCFGCRELGHTAVSCPKLRHLND